MRSSLVLNHACFCRFSKKESVTCARGGATRQRPRTGTSCSRASRRGVAALWSLLRPVTEVGHATLNARFQLRVVHLRLERGQSRSPC